MDAKLYLSFIITAFVITGMVRSEQSLTCENKPYRKYCIWQRQGGDGKFVDLPKNDAKYINHATAKMTFTKMDISDSGFYRCRLFQTSNNNYFSPPIRLCVTEKGTNLTLNCETFEGRQPHYAWDRTSPSISSNVQTANLTLYKIQYYDAGTYRCRYTRTGWKRWLYGNYTIVVVQGYPEIRSDNSQMKVAIGKSAYLRCSVYETHPSITEVWWTKGYTNARIQANDKKYEVQNKTSYTSLNVLNIKRNDAGEYRCYARNTRGEMFAKTTLVTGDLPRHPKAAKDMYSVKKLTTVILQCDPQTSIPPITELWWAKRRDGRFYNLTDFWKYSNGTLAAPNLHIKDVRSSDAAEYTCNVANAFGTSQVGMEVQLGNPPTVKAATTEYRPIRGRTITLNCNINDGTRMWWTRFVRGTEIDKERDKSSVSTTSSLTIQNIQAVDDGDYRCYGENKFGSNYDTIKILSGYIPTISTISHYYNGEYNTNIFLNVSIQNIHPGLNYVTWFQNDKLLKKSYRISGGSVSDPNLTIRHLKFKDSGKYICSIGNGIGFANATISLVVWRRPHISILGKPEIIIGSDASFICDVSLSNPSVQHILWRKGVEANLEQLVSENGGKYIIENNLSSSTLKVKSVTISDADTYTCVAVNMYSEGIGTIDLSVGSPPLVSISRDVYITKVGNNVNISCIIRNVPQRLQSTLYWMKGRGYYTPYIRKPLLIIRNTQLSDAGSYSCHVQNDFGSANDSTELKVLSALISKQFHEVNAHTSYTIRCDVSGGDRVIWRKNDKEVKLDKQQIYAGWNVIDPSLKIKNISHLDRGNYSCETAYRSFTAKSTTIQLLVRDIPLVSLSSQIKEISKGSDAMLDCSYDSYPKPTKVYWEKDKKIIELSDSSKTKYNGSSLEIPMLVIHDTAQSDSGKYVCFVKNSIGTGYSKNLQLSIIEPEKNTSTIGAVVGGIFAIVIALLVLIGLVVLFRRRSNNVNNIKPIRQETISNAENVELCTDGRGIRDNGLYLNVGIVSTSAVEPTKGPIITGDTEYYNLSDVQILCIRVEELKQYIEKKQKKEELKN